MPNRRRSTRFGHRELSKSTTTPSAACSFRNQASSLICFVSSDHVDDRADVPAMPVLRAWPKNAGAVSFDCGPRTDNQRAVILAVRSVPLLAAADIPCQKRLGTVDAEDAT